MFIILMAHTPGNWFNQWIPARFGFSDAAEIFVFCSGMASAVAFGRTYDRAGWALGTARISYRVWQIYWAHIATFLLTAAMLAAIDSTELFEKSYVGGLNLWRFFTETPDQLLGLFSLTYVPNFFDILPMYMVILLMVPIVMALSRIHLSLVFGFIAFSWIMAQGGILDAVGLERFQVDLRAEPWSDRPWFFNPFGWQLVFFTGFALMKGWIPAPPVNWMLILLALAILVACFTVSQVAIRELEWTWAREWRSDYRIWITKTDGGILRYIHFLAFAYIGWVVAGPQGRFLRATGTHIFPRFWGSFVAQITKVGQQSLAVFLVSIVLSRLGGFAIDQTNDNWDTVLIVNMVGFALLLATAYLAAWYKSQPWRKVVKTA